MIHPSTAPKSIIKLKIILKVNHVLYSNNGGKNIKYKFQCITKSMRNVCLILNNVHMTTYKQINVKQPSVPIIHCYVLV